MHGILRFQIYQKAALLEVVDRVHADIGSKTNRQTYELSEAEKRCQKSKEYVIALFSLFFTDISSFYLRRVKKLKALITAEEEKAKKMKAKSELKWLLLFSAVRDIEDVRKMKPCCIE